LRKCKENKVKAACQLTCDNCFTFPPVWVLWFLPGTLCTSQKVNGRSERRWDKNVRFFHARN
jgi:hypothetical protein